MLSRWLRTACKNRVHDLRTIGLGGSATARKPRSVSPQIELLEDRLAPAVLLFQEGIAGYSGSQDAWIDAKNPTQTKNEDKINVDKAGTSEEKQGLIRFDSIFGSGAGLIPAGSTINSVTLTVSLKETKGTTVSLHRMLQGWNETNVTANTFLPTVGIQRDGTEALATADSSLTTTDGQSGTVTFTGDALRATVQAWLDGSASNLGWVVVTTGKKFEFYSSEAGASQRPTLTINYTPPGYVPAAAANDIASTLNGAAVTIDVLSNDYVPTGDTITGMTILQQPGNGTASVNGSNQVVFTPPSLTHSGTDTIVYQFTTSAGETVQAGITVTTTYDPFGLGTVASFQQGNNGYAGTQDAWIDNKNKDETKNEDKVNVDKAGTSEEKQGLLRFDDIFGYGPGQVPPGATINAVRLVVSVKEAKSSTVSLHRMQEGWDESSVNANTFATGGTMIQPGTEALAAADITLAGVSGSNFTQVFSSQALLDTVRAWANGSASNFGWVFVTTGSKFEFYSSENSTLAFRPQLLIDYTPSLSMLPVANHDTAVSINGAPVVINVLQNDHVPGVTPTSISVSDPQNGSTTVVGNQIRYTPDAGFNGYDTFTYTFLSVNGESTEATVTVAAVTQIVIREGLNGYTGTQDTTLRSLEPDTTQGDDATVSVQELTREGLLRFDNLFGTGPNQIPLGTSILSANLSLNIFDDTNDPKPQSNSGSGSGSGSGAADLKKIGSGSGNKLGDNELALFRMLQQWDESTATWSSLNGGLHFDGQELSQFLLDARMQLSAGSQSADVTASVQAWAFGDENNGWGIVKKKKEDAWGFDSSEATNASLRPTLVITFFMPSALNLAPTIDVGGPYEITEGDSVQLDASASSDPDGDNLTYSWDLDNDGQYDDATGAVVDLTWSQLQNLGVNDGPAPYQFQLRVNDGQGHIEYAAIPLSVLNTAPTADLTNNGPALEGSTVTVSFVNASDPSHADTTAGLRYSFALGTSSLLALDYGSAGTSSTADFIFPDQGEYTVFGRIFDKDGSFTDYTTVITIGNAPPTVAITGNPVNLAEGSPIVLGSSVADAGSSDTHTYQWQVTASNGQVIADGSGASFSFTPVDNGTYTVTLTVTDNSGDFATDTAVTSVFNVAPTPTILGAPASSPEGTALSLSSAVSDPGVLDTHTYLWQVVASNGQVIADGSGNSFDFTPVDNGTYTVTLTVTDNAGDFTSDTAVITVTNVAPTPSITGAPASSPENTLVSLGSTASDPGTLDTRSYLWQVVASNGQVIADGSGTTFDFTPFDNGTYTVTLTATDSDGDSSFDTAVITVTNVAPTATFSVDPGSYVEGGTATVRLTGLADAATADQSSLRFSFATSLAGLATSYGAATTDSFTNVTLPDSGAVTLFGRIFDKDGGFTDYTRVINVANVAPTAAFFSNGPANEGSAASFRFTSGADASSVDAGSLRYSVALSPGGLASSYGAASADSTLSLTIDDNGTYTVHGRVFDKDGGFTDYTTTVTINNIAPATGLTNSGPVNVGQLATVSFAGSNDVSTTDTNAGLRFSVALDPSQLATSYDAASATASGSFRFDTIGSHTVYGRIFDKDGGFQDVATTIVVRRGDIRVVGADAGGLSQVKVYDAETNQLKFDFIAFGNFTGGARVAAADVNGDGVKDIIVGAGTGGLSQVNVYDGTNGALLRAFIAFGGFTGGVYVAGGDLNGDGAAEVVVGADAGGGPQVTVYDGKTGGVLNSFYALAPGFTGGVRVAVGDLNGDGRAEVITAAGRGAAPQVTVYNGLSGQVLRSFYAFTPTFAGGVFVAAGDVNGDGLADIITGAGAGGGPQVTVYDGGTNGTLASFYAMAPNFTGGIRVGAAYVNGDNRVDILTSAGPGGGPQATSFDSATLAVLGSFFAYDPTFKGGVYTS